MLVYHVCFILFRIELTGKNELSECMLKLVVFFFLIHKVFLTLS